MWGDGGGGGWCCQVAAKAFGPHPPVPMALPARMCAPLLQRLADEHAASEARLEARLQRELEARERDIRAEAQRSRDEHLRVAIARMDAASAEERRRQRSEDQATMAAQAEVG